MSFLPAPYRHPYKINPEYEKSVAYFSMEYAIDQSFKIYSGGLGFLAGSHMRSAADLRQNLIGIGIKWSFGYYDQCRGENREMAAQHRRKIYAFLEETDIHFPIDVHGAAVSVRAYYLPGETFGTVPMFFLTTDLEENDELSRAISYRLYDSDHLRRIAQYILLGSGGAKLLEKLGVQPDVYHLNEAHGLSAAFRLYQKSRDLEAVRKRMVFTTHTPEEAGNEKTDFNLLEKFHFFGNSSGWDIRQVTGIEGDTFNHTLAALRMSRIANGVSELHGEVARKMWKGYPDICQIIHVTNAQNKKFWAEPILEKAHQSGDLEAVAKRKFKLKKKLFRTVADQTGKIFDPKVLTLVWARRFASYKRADLITRDIAEFNSLVSNSDRPIQILWAGKPYPSDYGAIDLFNHLISLVRDLPNVGVLVGYELDLSRQLKQGSDLWLNNPVVSREASGTSGMTAAMNGSVNISTYDGWVREFCDENGLNEEGKRNSFIVPPADPSFSAQSRDDHDRIGILNLIRDEALPLYYDNPSGWNELVQTSMNDVAPKFDADRMADEYYRLIYADR